MTKPVETYRVNNDQTATTSAGEFLIVQRNEGYACNDGSWIVSLLPELYWSGNGVLRQRRSGQLIGIFSTDVEAVKAINETELPAEDDRMVM